MPTYTYECEKCKKSFDKEMSIEEHENTKVKCPKCNSQKVHRIYEPFLAQTAKKS